MNQSSRHAGVAVVTGASGGVGRATAREFARRGYDVAVLARGQAGLAGAAAEVEAAGRRALILPADVSDFDAVADAAGRTEADLGPISVWVNDAMTTIYGRVVDVDPRDLARAVDVTFLGQVWGTKAALAYMVPRNEGAIVNVGSALAYLGIPLQAPYCASKFACRAFFEVVREELIEQGSRVRIRMVHLPAVNTPQFDWCKTIYRKRPRPVAPIYQPEVAARAIANAAQGGRPTRIVGSWNRFVIATASVAPSFAMRYAARTATRAQLSDEPTSDDQPANLQHPSDDAHDYGSHGRFDDEAGGALDPSFLRTLPATARDLVASIRRSEADAQ